MMIKKGDKVKVITGKYRNKEGIVLLAFPKKNKVLVEGVNMLKKHRKPSKDNSKGGIIDIQLPIHVSNVMIIDPSTHQATRIGNKYIKGKKLRFSKKSGQLIDK